MKTIHDITRDEYNALVKYHRQVGYTENELAHIMNLTREYVNPHVSTCLGCTNALRDAKNELYGWFLFHKESIELHLAARESEPRIKPGPGRGHKKKRDEEQ